jgi:hypothetical protein
MLQSLFQLQLQVHFNVCLSPFGNFTGLFNTILFETAYCASSGLEEKIWFKLVQLISHLDKTVQPGIGQAWHHSSLLTDIIILYVILLHMVYNKIKCCNWHCFKINNLTVTSEVRKAITTPIFYHLILHTLVNSSNLNYLSKWRELMNNLMEEMYRTEGLDTYDFP